MIKLKKILFNKGSSIALAFITLALAIIPENVFKLIKLNKNWSDEVTVIVNRTIFAIAILAIGNILYGLYYKNRKKVTIKKHSIQIEYGNILKYDDGKVVINFDECYTTKVGDAPEDIKPQSVCGQYLNAHPIDNLQTLIDAAGVKPAEERSRYKSQVRYESGTLVPNGRYLLMAFARLDERGIGNLTYEEYLKCLDKLWEQLERYHGTDDVYLPILGSRITHFEREFSQQQLLDIMISSYKLSSKKLNAPNTLHIVCWPREGFSINEVSGID